MTPARAEAVKNSKNAMGDKFFKAIIESPKGDNRRRHFDKKKNRVIDLGPLKKAIPINNGIAPVNYGFIKNTFCKADGEEIDVLLVSDNKLKIGEEVKIYPIALILRADGDDKIVAVDKSTKGKYKSWDDLPNKDLIEKFFSYHYEFLSIKDSQKAYKYILDHETR